MTTLNAPTILQIRRYEKYINDILSISIPHIHAILKTSLRYDAYRVFYTVARFGSFTKAASVLLASQPNLTRTIRNLESALGCTLFVRSNRGAVLTPDYAKKIGADYYAKDAKQSADIAKSILG